MSAMFKHVREALKKAGLRKSDVTVDITGSNHLKITLPNGHHVTCSASPSCPYVAFKIANDIKKAMR